MKIRFWFAMFVVLNIFLFVPVTGSAAETESALEKGMSDALDTWREGRYEQLFEQLAHRGKTSRETFVKKMRESTIRPACCWQKMENFRILNEKRTEATVYVKVGLEGTPGTDRFHNPRIQVDSSRRRLEDAACRCPFNCWVDW